MECNRTILNWKLTGVGFIFRKVIWQTRNLIEVDTKPIFSFPSNVEQIYSKVMCMFLPWLSDYRNNRDNGIIIFQESNCRKKENTETLETTRSETCRKGVQAALTNYDVWRTGLEGGKLHFFQNCLDMYTPGLLFKVIPTLCLHPEESWT